MGITKFAVKYPVSVLMITLGVCLLGIISYNKLGTACSHGCVRLKAGDAKWIYDNCKLQTKIVIYKGASSTDPLGKPTAYKLSSSHTWDPTDPNMAYKCKQHGCH